MVFFVTFRRALLFVPVLLGILVNAQDTTSDIIPPPLTPSITTTTDSTTDVVVSTIASLTTLLTTVLSDGTGLSSTLTTYSVTTLTDVSTPTSTDSSLPASTTDLATSTTDAATSSTSVIPPPINPPQPTSSSSPSHSNAGAIAGGIVGGLVGLAIIAGLIFLFLRRRSSDYRGRTGRSGGSHPPSPRLKSPWLGGISLGGGGTASKKPHRGQRLGSVGGESAQTSPPRSGDGHERATSDDAHELGESTYSPRAASGSVRNGVGAGAAIGAVASGRPRGSVSLDADSGRNNSNSSYDLSVFQSNVGTSRGTSRLADPFSSETSISAGGANGGGASDLARGSSTSRLARKPAPKYDDGSEPSSPTSPVSPRQSKPPVSGMPRTRTHSNSSSLRAQAAANNDAAAAGGSLGPSSLEGPHLTRQGSQGTLGGAFKFAGEKEGPVHYLMPDPPAPPAS